MSSYFQINNKIKEIEFVFMQLLRKPTRGSQTIEKHSLNDHENKVEKILTLNKRIVC